MPKTSRSRRHQYSLDQMRRQVSTSAAPACSSLLVPGIAVALKCTGPCDRCAGFQTLVDAERPVPKPVTSMTADQEDDLA